MQQNIITQIYFSKWERRRVQQNSHVSENKLNHAKKLNSEGAGARYPPAHEPEPSKVPLWPPNACKEHRITNEGGRTKAYENKDTHVFQFFSIFLIKSEGGVELTQPRSSAQKELVQKTHKKMHPAKKFSKLLSFATILKKVRAIKTFSKPGKWFKLLLWEDCCCVGSSNQGLKRLGIDVKSKTSDSKMKPAVNHIK